MEINLERAYKYLKREVLDDKVEEAVFKFTVNFYHLLNLVWYKSNAKKVTKNYCSYLLSECLHNIINAAKLCNMKMDDLEQDIKYSYDLFKQALYNSKTVDSLIIAFNGETALPKEYDSIAKFALLLIIFEDKMDISWENIIEALETTKIC